MLLVSWVWVFCNQLRLISDFYIHQMIWFEQKCLKMCLIIQILYFIICNIFQNDWLLTTSIFLDVGRHQLKKQVFDRYSFSCFSCCCFIIIFFTITSNFDFCFIFFYLFCFFFHGFSVLIPEVFHYLCLYLVINFSQFRIVFLCLFWWYWALSKESMDLWNM